jgi:uncharacterized RDD family membrane protein YckC
MGVLRTILLGLSLGLVSFLNANNIWLMDQKDQWSLVVQKQLQGSLQVHVYQQKLHEELNPKFVFKSQGKLHGAYVSGNTLRFVFPKSVFELSSENKLELVHKAPLNAWFIGPLRQGENEKWLFKDHKANEFFVMDLEDKKRGVLPDLSPLKDAAVLPWISQSGDLFLANLQLEKESLPFALVQWQENLASVRFDELENFKLGAFSEDREGVWMLPREGTLAMKWNGQIFKPTQLRPLPDPFKRWFSRLKLSSEVLYISANAEKLEFFLGDQQKSLDDQQAKSDESSKPEQQSLVQQLTLFSLLILSFILFIQWRTRFQQQMLKNSDQKIVMTSRTASILIRGLAFWMDVYFISLPIIFISSHFYNIELDGLQLDEMMSMQLSRSEQAQMIMERINKLLPLMASLMVSMCLYHALMEKFFGGSLGKLFFRMKVVSLDGSPLSWKQVVLRAIMKSLDFSLTIPPSLFFIILSPLRQSLGDKVAKTQVVVQTPS